MREQLYGGRMATWVKYFENAALDGIQGVAYNANGELATSACAKENVPGCQKMKFFTGDQSNVDFLKVLVKEGAGVDPASVKAGISPNWDRVGWDLIIDDGSHVPEDNLISFGALYPFVRPGLRARYQRCGKDRCGGPACTATEPVFATGGTGNNMPPEAEFEVWVVVCDKLAKECFKSIPSRHDLSVCV